MDPTSTAGPTGLLRIIAAARWRLRGLLQRRPGLRRRRRQRLLRRADRHRRGLHQVTLVAITGSTAKSTVKRLAAAVLSKAGPCAQAPLYASNLLLPTARAMLEIQPTDRYGVIEVPTTKPGFIDPYLALIRPHVGIVTNIGTDHRAAFGSMEAIGEEKGKLVASLPPDGVAVLNADDPLVMAMSQRFEGRVVTYGLTSGAMVRGQDLRGAWPERLSLTARYGEERVHVQTQLLGLHWGASVLAALAVGVAEGIPLADAADAIGDVMPVPGRMSEVALEDGITFIRDDCKASLASVDRALEFLAAARAPRKIAVLGTLSDYGGSVRRHYRRTALAAAEAADLVVFAGPASQRALHAQRHPGGERIVAFTTVRDASRHLDDVLRPGDLVLVKGSNKADHLLRIVLSRTQAVACWRERCGRSIYCDTCELLERPEAPAQSVSLREIDREALGPTVPGPSSSPSPALVVVGLGNPGSRYEGTPHNVGHAAVAAMAETLGVPWHREGDVLLARARHRGAPILLVRLLVPINRTGPALAALAQRLGFGPSECVLLQDDFDLPLGQVRVRLKGSSGGHRGVGSVLQELQRADIRRVKIGVRRSERRRLSRDQVLEPFAPADRPLVDRACREAVDLVYKLLAGSNRPLLVTALLIDPFDARRVLAATYGEGILLSTDGGRTFRPTWRGADLTFATALLADPGQRGRLWVGTELPPGPKRRPRSPRGIYSSEDGGESWTLAAGPPELEATPGDDPLACGPASLRGRGRFDVTALVLHRDQPQRILAGARDGLLRSEDHGQTWIDLTGILQGPGCSALAIDPGDSRVLLAAEPSEGRVYRSIDGGASWTQAELANGAGGLHVAFVFAPDAPGLVLAARQGDGSPENPQGALLRSSDGGLTWQECFAGRNIVATAFDPHHPGRAYLAFSDGGSWQRAGKRKRGTIGGLMRSYDEGATWQELELEELEGIQPTALAPSPEEPGVLFLGTRTGPLRIELGSGASRGSG